MSRELADYAGLEALWSRFVPETPFGRAAKAHAATFTERPALEERWDLTDEALRLLGSLGADQVRLDRIRHHLKRLPRFPEAPREAFDEVELFQLKKFLANHRALLGLLPEGAKARFGLVPLPAALVELLGAGREGDESFHVADAFDPELASVRGALRGNEASSAALREASESALRSRFGFAFEGRPFLLVPRARLGEPAAATGLLDVEPWDSERLCVRPRPSAGALRLAEERAALLSRERAVEARVLRRLSGPLSEALPLFREQARAVERLDLALAGARLAREAGLVRPVLGDGPAVYYTVPGWKGDIGFIAAVHGKFCASCNRVRLTSQGFLRPCLASEAGCDLRALLRSGADDTQLLAAIRETIWAKPREHHFEDSSMPATRGMYRIGG